MSTIKITVSKKGLRKDTVEKKVTEALQKMFPEASVSVSLYTPPESRADRFAEAKGKVEDAKAEFESLKEELESWKDSIPENLQGSDKYSQLEEGVSNLEECISGCDTVEGTDVEFPSMMG